MKKVIIGVIAGIVIIIVALNIYKVILQKQYDKFGKWERVYNSNDDQLPWISIYWNTDSIGNKMAMFVPVKIEGLPNEFRFQFDDGANLTMLYGNTLKPFCEHYPLLQKKSETTIIRKDTIPYLSDLHLQIDNVSYSSPAVVIRQDFGDTFPSDSLLSHTFRHDLGTLGVDICKNKVLIMDYPHNRLCIVDSIPAAYHTTYADITLDDQGRPIFKMAYKGKDYKIEFDCGSSMFPILARQKIIGELSGEPGTDTTRGSSWGKTIAWIGRPMKDSFTLARHRYGNIKVYTSEDANSENVPYGCDGLTGNVLFLNNVLIIDFKNKKVGIM